MFREDAKRFYRELGRKTIKMRDPSFSNCAKVRFLHQIYARFFCLSMSELHDVWGTL